MTVYLMISLPKYRIYTVYIWFWPTLGVSLPHIQTAHLMHVHWQVGCRQSEAEGGEVMSSPAMTLK